MWNVTLLAKGSFIYRRTPHISDIAACSCIWSVNFPRTPDGVSLITACAYTWGKTVKHGISRLLSNFFLSFSLFCVHPFFLLCYKSNTNEAFYRKQFCNHDIRCWAVWTLLPSGLQEWIPPNFKNGNHCRYLKVITCRVFWTHWICINSKHSVSSLSMLILV